MSMRPPILFAHGLESGPVGRKTEMLRAAGYDLTAPDCRGLALDERIARLLEALAGMPAQTIVVGSSFGGIAGLVAAQWSARRGHPPAGLLLCAPALQLEVPPPWTIPLARPCPVVVVHGEHDEIIPIAVSEAYCRVHHVELVRCDDDHSLARSSDAITAALDRLADARAPA